MLENISLLNYQNELDSIRIIEWINCKQKLDLTNNFSNILKNNNNFNISIYKFFNNYFYCLESKYNDKLKLECFGNIDIFIPNTNHDYNIFFEKILIIFINLKNFI